MLTSKYQVGLLGAGYIADWHAEALDRLPQVNIAAVCDQNFQRAEAFAERHNIIHAYGALDDMLEEQDLDVVHVLVPPDHHYATANAILAAGVSVLLEKPMCVSVEECESLIEHTHRSQRTVGVSHNYLFCEVYEMLKKDLKEGALGRVEQVTITRNKELELLRSGQFGNWMLREPSNIILEIGPHSIGQMLDLIGAPEELDAKAFDPIDLPGNRCFYRRWQVNACKGSTSVDIRYSFNGGFAEDTICVRGSIASATVDMERNTYILHHHTKYGVDFDRYFMVKSEARRLCHQARRNLVRYILSKFRLSKKGNAFGSSIAQSLKAFYTEMPTPADQRISARFGLEVVRLCQQIGRAAHVENAGRAMCPSVRKAPGRAPEILVLGGTGFIGKHLVRELLSVGHSVRILTRNPGSLPADFNCPNIDVLQGDMTNPSDVEKALDNIRYVYHLARAVVETWDDYYGKDVLPTKSIAESCLAHGVKRLIYTGTIASYYAGIKAGTITERTPLDPHIHRRENYARAKAASETELMKMYQEKGLPVVIVRPGIVLGSGAVLFIGA